MPIEDRNLQAGTDLRMTYKGKEYSCQVVETDEGLRFRLEDGRVFLACPPLYKVTWGKETYWAADDARTPSTPTSVSPASSRRAGRRAPMP